jgi:alanyl-tRNA synthetase
VTPGQAGAPGGAARPYFEDPYRTRFEAAVTARRQDDAGLWVALDRSYFYPESGGQEADRGALAGVPVLDVQEDADGVVWHRVARDVPDAVAAEIDGGRRASSRRQHTGQHVLSQAFLRELGANTVSSHLGDDGGTLDFDRPSLTWEEIERVEAVANRVVWEDRPVVSRLVAAEDLGRYPLRRPPKVAGTVRLLEIEGWDVSACGGTHCARTGEVGAIKIRGWERMRGNVRVEFVCGDRAWRDHAWRVRQLVEAGRRRNTGDREVVEVLERALAERDDLRKQVKALETQLARAEAAELAAAHRAAGGPVLCRVFAERPPDALRALVRQLAALGVERVVLAARAPAPFVVAGRPRAGAEDLRRWLPLLRERAGGRGGGGADEVQVTAADGESAAAAAEALAREWR